jgi:hypothetical protein
MTMTHSGVLCDRSTGFEPATLEDLALSLSRMTRFAGHTRFWWTVLDHSLYVHSLAHALDPDVRLALLLHDAHEAITSDVPSDVKPNEMRETQAQIDIGIVAQYFPPGIHKWLELNSIIKHFDRRALYAEARVVGPEKLAHLSQESLKNIGFDVPSESDVEVLENGIRCGILSNPQMLHLGVDAPNVQRYLRLVKAETEHFKHLLETTIT